MAKAKELKAVDVTIAPGQELHVHVVRDGEDLAHHIVRVEPDSGQTVIHAAPPPPEPVQDPDPISDPSSMEKAEKKPGK